MTSITPAQLRECLIAATEEIPTAAELANTLPVGRLYTPPAHLKALSPDKPLVIGMRGAGKTYWWLQLQEQHARTLIFGEKGNDGKSLECRPGYGKKGNPDDFPTKRILDDLRRDGLAPRSVWRAVMCWHVSEIRTLMSTTRSWSERVRWCEANVEQVERTLYTADQAYFRDGRTLLVLFDSLDDTADEWVDINAWLKGLFQVMLEFRNFRAIRAKAFVRPDMLADRETFAFPDGSKLQYEQVTLDWTRADLYALLWQSLGNAEAPHGDLFRSWCLSYGLTWHQADGIWPVPEALRRDEDLQRLVFHALAGEWMGKDARRGFPYTWLPNHLGDASAKVSPRSFIVAVHNAAIATREKHPGHEFALHYEDIKTGVGKASSVRVADLEQEYPWIKDAMTSLNKRNVPCAWAEIEGFWQDAQLIKRLEKQPRAPMRLKEGLPGIRDELVELAIFEYDLKKYRIDIPDVFRVGYGLGRKGGIRPVR